jgi:hypothetical protein
MLSGVLRSRRAVAVSIEIMRAFVELRRAAASHAAIEKRLEDLERETHAKLGQHDQAARPDLSRASADDFPAASTETSGRLPAARRREVGSTIAPGALDERAFRCGDRGGMATRIRMSRRRTAGPVVTVACIGDAPV